jgi:hypothetical protein
MATHDEVVTPQGDRAFRTWVADAVRPVIGWILLALGALSIFLGWYGVSGQSVPAKQLPYLISGGVTGLALVLVGASFLAGDHLRRQIDRLDGVERKVDDLYTLLVVAPSDPGEHVSPVSEIPSAVSPSTTATDTNANRLVAVPAGTTYHRPGCALVAGKVEAADVDATAITARSLQPCSVCDPDRGAESR